MYTMRNADKYKQASGCGLENRECPTIGLIDFIDQTNGHHLRDHPVCGSRDDLYYAEALLRLAALCSNSLSVSLFWWAFAGMCICGVLCLIISLCLWLCGIDNGMMTIAICITSGGSHKHTHFLFAEGR